MKNIGVLWDEEVSWSQETPFGEDEATNKDYEVYSELAQQEDMTLFIAKYTWYNDGFLEKAWRFKNGRWVKDEEVEIEGVYDKFKFDNETKSLKKKINQEIGVLNHYELEKVCKDKYTTYELFPEHVPETKMGYRENIEKMLQKHDKVVIKPRYDFGGRGIKVIDSVDEIDHSDQEAEEYIAQAFVDSSEGIPELEINGMHDLRAVLVNGEVSEAYIRQPQEGYLSNQSLGGTMTYVDLQDYPKSARKILESVKKEFEQYRPNIYTVDLIFDKKGNPWILELNSKPGIGYFREEEEKEYELPTMKKVIKALKQL